MSATQDCGRPAVFVQLHRAAAQRGKLDLVYQELSDHWTAILQRLYPVWALIGPGLSGPGHIEIHSRTGSRVTVGGESAGGWSVCAHLVSPGSRGLFAQAIIQSGACQTETRDQAGTVGAGFAAKAGCADSYPANVIACLRALPAASLVDDEGNLGFTSLLARGTRALPEDPAGAIRSGDFSHLPVLIGGTPQGSQVAVREQNPSLEAIGRPNCHIMSMGGAVVRPVAKIGPLLSDAQGRSDPLVRAGRLLVVFAGPGDQLRVAR